MKRREIFRAGAGMVLAAPTFISLKGTASAQNKAILVANYGGDWSDRTIKYIEAPLLESQGYTITRDLSEITSRVAKLIAERALPRSSFDVIHCGEVEAFSLEQKNVLEELDFSKMPNAEKMIPSLRHKYYMPWLFSSWEIVYRPDKIADMPTSYADLWNPKYLGKVGVMDQNYPSAMQAASILGSGKMNDFEAAKRMLLDWKKAVKPVVYIGHQQAQAGIQSDEIWMIANFRSRGLQWQKDGLNVRTAYPKEGGIVTIFCQSIPKRAGNKSGAYAYLNASLDPNAIGNLCADNFYSPSVTGAVIKGDVASKITYTAQELDSLRNWDQEFWSANKAAWFDWWKKIFLS